MPPACPCQDAHRRLMDVHEDIHRASESYFDAEEFRRFLNSAIQNSRGVSFLLQKRKSRWSNFDDWYSVWQGEARANEIMSWGVQSRNRIVKEEDLRTLSVAEVTYYGPRLREAEDVIHVPPSFTADDMINVYKDLIARDRPSGPGTIRVSRKWFDDQLPQHELIAALRELYAGVAKLIRVAHEQSGVGVCELGGFRRACVDANMSDAPRCFPLAPPSASIDVATGTIYDVEYGIIEMDEAAAKRSMERYGEPIAFDKGVIDDVPARMAVSKRFLEKDGYAGSVLMFYRGNEVVRGIPLQIPADRPRELVFEHAIEMLGAMAFDGVMFASEMWITRLNARTGNPKKPWAGGPSEPNEFYDQDPVGGRDEALVVYGLSKDGRARTIAELFRKTSSGYEYRAFIDSDDSKDVPQMLIGPVSRAWGTHQGRASSE